ncbi:MAG: 30S ribosomal protein S11, partial [Candidatus Aminicenantes bacterium]|nr:30S ribosomal protein S11 [Candidatus Aminicenantes bacterium]
MATKKTKSKSKKKEKKIVSHGIMTINSTFNNTVIAITDADGNVLTWCSGGV